jgi:hypothetical protein
MLDSGAFSAYWLDKEIDIDDYCDFIIKHKHLVANYINLDVIPGKPGTLRTTDDVKESSRRSFENFQYMKSRGLSPLPVFHQGEPFHWLERYLEDGEPYICISTNKELSTESNRKWLDIVFTMICDEQGNPSVKTHGLGITIWELMTRYPWESVDSTSWSLIPGYGRIIVPQYNKGIPIYDKRPISVIMSGWENKSKAAQRMQYDSLGPMEKEAVLRFGIGNVQFKHRRTDLGK